MYYRFVRLPSAFAPLSSTCSLLQQPSLGFCAARSFDPGPTLTTYSVPTPTVLFLAKVIRDFVQDFSHAGFRLNPNQTVLTPTQDISFLGFRIDTIANTISLLPSRVQDTHKYRQNLTPTLPTAYLRRAAGLLSFYLSLYGYEFNTLQPLFPPFTRVNPFPQCGPVLSPTCGVASRTTNSYAELPRCVGRTWMPRLQYFQDLQDRTQAVTPTTTVIVHRARTNIYYQEALALLLAALATPPDSTLRCGILSLVHAVRKGHEHAMTGALALSFFVLFVAKHLTIKFVPPAANPLRKSALTITTAHITGPVERAACTSLCKRVVFVGAVTGSWQLGD